MNDEPVNHLTATLPSRIRCAGGAVWRTTATGNVEVILVHRTRYRDWSWPKGKVDPGEALIEAAIREVQEETGLSCRSHDELVTFDFIDQSGDAKTVTYWSMTVLAEIDPPNPAEIAQVEWLELDRAKERLTCAEDQVVIDRLKEAIDYHS